MIDFEIKAPPEILAALENGRREGSWIAATCPICQGHSLRAGVVKGKPWWGCMRCHREKDGP